MALTPEDDVTAAELALGLLEGEERAVLLRRVLQDREFAQAVDLWRDRFVALLADYAAVEPPAWIEQRLARIGENARPWRWATAASSLVAAGLALALIARPADVPPARQVVAPPITFAAAMAPADTQDAGPFAALFDARRGQVRVPAGIDVPAGRVAELWRIGADGVPKPLGLLLPEGTTALTLSPQDRAALAAGATLAISIEPLGGSPTSLPSGPVVATGKLIRL